jgi:hypothetical protein
MNLFQDQPTKLNPNFIFSLYSSGLRQSNGRRLGPNPPGDARHVIANIAQGPVAGKYPTTSFIRSHFYQNYLKVSKINFRQVSLSWKYRCLFRKKKGFTSKHTGCVNSWLVLTVALYSEVSTFSVWRPLKPPLATVTCVTRVYSLCTESSSSLRMRASRTRILHTECQCKEQGIPSSDV